MTDQNLLLFKERYKGKQSERKDKEKTPAPAAAAPVAPAAPGAGPVDAALVSSLEQQVAEQGDKVRQLKGNKAEKAAVDAEVALLLDLKKKLSLASGQPLQQPSGKKGKKK